MATSASDPWTYKLSELKKILAQPLPGGRGFQHQRDLQIQRLCYELAHTQLPQR